MDAAYLSAISALAGSAVGALASFASTWMTQHSQYRTQVRTQMRNRREVLYGEFIEEASRLFADAADHQLEDLRKLVVVYGLVGKVRLFASREVIREAETVMRLIAEAYRRPTMSVEELQKTVEGSDVDPLRTFSEACRRDLVV